MRVKICPNNANLQKIHMIRGLYAVKLSKSISNNTLLVNIDESLINRKNKNSLSWSFKDVPTEKKTHLSRDQLDEFW